MNTLPEADYQDELNFPGYFGVPSRCEYRLYTTNVPKTVVIISELDDNPDTSITNRVEVICCMLWKALQEPKASEVIFIEHYPGTSSGKEDDILGEHASLVTFARESDDEFKTSYTRLGKGKNHTLVNPKWQHLSMKEIRSMVDGTT